jgi:hypothetical protein
MSDTLNIPAPLLVNPDDLKAGYQPRDKASVTAQVAFLVACFRDLKEPQLVPIIALDDGTIVDGHCRWEALRIVGKGCRVIRWHGKNPPTPEQVQRINSAQARVEPPAATLAKWSELLGKGLPLETIAKASGKSLEKAKREVAAWEKVKGTPGIEKESKAGILAKAAEATKEAERSNAGKIGAKGQTLLGNRSEKIAEAKRPKAEERKYVGGGHTSEDTADQSKATTCQECATLKARVADLEASLAKAEARAKAAESGKEALRVALKEEEAAHAKLRKLHARLMSGND